MATQISSTCISKSMILSKLQWQTLVFDYSEIDKSVQRQFRQRVTAGNRQ